MCSGCREDTAGRPPPSSEGSRSPRPSPRPGRGHVTLTYGSSFSRTRIQTRRPRSGRTRGAAGRPSRSLHIGGPRFPDKARRASRALRARTLEEICSAQPYGYSLSRVGVAQGVEDRGGCLDLEASEVLAGSGGRQEGWAMGPASTSKYAAKASRVKGRGRDADLRGIGESAATAATWMVRLRRASRPGNRTSTRLRGTATRRPWVRPFEAVCPSDRDVRFQGFSVPFWTRTGSSKRSPEYRNRAEKVGRSREARHEGSLGRPKLLHPGLPRRRRSCSG